MRRPVPPHPAVHGLVPPPEAFERLVERTDHHWWWAGDFRLFDCDRFAILRVRRVGAYVVVRALWARASGVDDLRVRLANTCGAVACVNPAHVERERDGVPVILPEGAQMHDGVPVRPMLSTRRVHIVPVDVDHAVCGWRIRGHRGTPPRAVITCVECLAMWRARGYPLQEST